MKEKRKLVTLLHKLNKGINIVLFNHCKTIIFLIKNIFIEHVLFELLLLNILKSS